MRALQWVLRVVSNRGHGRGRGHHDHRRPSRIQQSDLNRLEAVVVKLERLAEGPGKKRK